ncbi:glycosyltransferase involved in cell wall biosynthesis [Winogradskyella wandonensis]|uniref:Glycosyltransferase involved in cell wall biosynthesis n=1 Tax=Winogradskyella wandonensis TaxID=1442586 RepID=A0A4R1KUE2_9FLAO|nr:glycosyltransferase family 2 protein [Winogradskyella wandonensis]TCK68825.1 glycosyltransferase involved in cell wall biosynthesis [Winogradskyella wandonensis]
MSKAPLVSVVMITYNHQDYIEEAINGVLIQECDFEVELIIANDSSTDKTDNTINKLIATYSGDIIIRYYNHSKNKGIMPNFIWALNQCDGKYIALCEGDDYWTDSSKLKRQVSFLEKNIFCSAIAENSMVLYDNGTKNLFGIKKSRQIKEKEIVRCRQFATASIVFRNNLRIPEAFNSLIAGDTPLFLLINKEAPIYYENIVSSIYRRGKQGETYKFSGLSKRKKLVSYNLFLNEFTNENYSQIFNLHIRRIESSATREHKLSRFLRSYINRIDNYIYKLYLKWFNVKQHYYFDIANYPFYKKIFYRIFG